MKGIILADDSRTCLHPLTLGVPKQLLLIYGKSIIYYPIQTLMDAGIGEVLVTTTTKEHQSLLKDDRKFRVSFKFQFIKNQMG